MFTFGFIVGVLIGVFIGLLVGANNARKVKAAAEAELAKLKAKLTK